MTASVADHKMRTGFELGTGHRHPIGLKQSNHRSAIQILVNNGPTCALNDDMVK